MDWNTLLQKVLEALLPILAVYAFGYIAKIASDFWVRFKFERPAAAIVLERAAEFAVKAAEQQGLAGLIEDKKEYALNIAEGYLAMNGVKLDLSLIDAAVEKAVLEYMGKDEPTAAGFNLGNE